jgi:hypothetical protein
MLHLRVDLHCTRESFRNANRSIEGTGKVQAIPAVVILPTFWIFHDAITAPHGWRRVKSVARKFFYFKGNERNAE